MEKNKRSGGITFLVIVNAVGCGITLIFWLLVWLNNLVPSPGDLTVLSERANAASTYGFMIADFLYSVPLLFMTTVGLWRMRPWGWTTAQMVNILWIFSMTVIWIRDLHTAISPGGILFLPFPFISIWAIRYLWKNRLLFWKD